MEYGEWKKKKKKKKKTSPPRPFIMPENMFVIFQHLKLPEEATLQSQETDMCRLKHQGNRSTLFFHRV